MPLPLAIVIGAGIGAVAGVAVYGAKILWDGGSWSWRDAAAAGVGGLVGGAAFPLVMTGLAAAGLPAGVSFALSGGLAWGGLWTLAQDAASWALGRRRGMAEPGRYIMATVVGIALSAALLPLASRVVGPGGGLVRHDGAVASYLSPARPLTANVVKAEAEFLAYGAGNEAASRALRLGEGGRAPRTDARDVTSPPVDPATSAAAPARPAVPQPRRSSRGLVGALSGR